MRTELWILFAAAARLWAQNASFEVASIKRNVSGDGRITQTLQPGGCFVANNVSLRQLIVCAYRLPDVQLSGGPAWGNSERYEVIASAPGATTADEITPRLRKLLADRFQLSAHIDKREIAVYALVLARKDGQLGPKLSGSTADCPAAPGAGRARGAPPAGPAADAQLGARPVCSMRVAPFALVAGGTPMAAFASVLSQLTQKIAVDRTGLTGTFDAELVWTPDESPFIGPSPPGAPPIPPGYDPNGSPLTTAIPEQLGLKLESRKELADTLGIDHVERPMEN